MGGVTVLVLWVELLYCGWSYCTGTVGGVTVLWVELLYCTMSGATVLYYCTVGGVTVLYCGWSY